MLKVKVYNPGNVALPERATPKSSAKDIRANLEMINPKFMFGRIETVVVKFNCVSGPYNPEFTDIGEEGGQKAVILFPNSRMLIPSGLKMQLPEGYHMDVRPRSGLALKYGLEIVNSPGLIDEDYRGDVGIIVKNGGSNLLMITDQDRIAQVQLAADIDFYWDNVNSEDELTNTERGEGGFNSSGSK